MKIIDVDVPADMSIADGDRRLADVAAELAADWFVRQCENNFAMLYLYMIETNRETGEGGKLAIAESNQELPGDDWKLATGERISPSWDQDRARVRIGLSMRSLSILGMKPKNAK